MPKKPSKKEEAQVHVESDPNKELDASLIRYEPQGDRMITPLDQTPEEFSQGLTRRSSNRTVFIEWVRKNLVEGVDFARLHIIKKSICDLGKDCTNPKHFSKPTLLKPGAEKVCGMVAVIPKFPKEKDFEDACLQGVEIKQIFLVCYLENAKGQILAEGAGARSVAQDNGDINKSIKMAEKSAQINATLRLGGLSEIFTQDIEDMKEFAEGSEPTTHEAGQTHKTFDPTKEPFRFGNKYYDRNDESKNMMWSEIPVDYIEWMVKNVSQGAIKVKAEATLKWKKLAHEAQVAVEDKQEGLKFNDKDSVEQEEARKKQAEATEAEAGKVFDKLDEALTIAVKAGKMSDLDNWARTNKVLIQKLPDKHKEALRTAFRKARDIITEKQTINK